MPGNSDREEFEEAAEIIGLVEGTVKEMKQYVRNHEMDDEQLEQLLKAEQEMKDRKTAVEFLQKRLGIEVETRDPGETGERDNDSGEKTDTEIDKETLLQLLGGTVDDLKDYVKENDPSDDELQEILHAEKVVNDRSTAISFLKSYSKKRELEEDFKQAEYDFKQLKEDLERIEEDVLEEGVELDLDSAEIDEEELGDGEGDDEEETEPEDEEDREKEDEDSGDEEPEPGDEQDEEEKKKELVEELGLDLSEEELEEIGLEELEDIKEEKEKREELIDELKGEFDEEDLRNASTSDLRKLEENVSGSQETGEKEDEELREEAEEDLEMLMGAVKTSEDGEKEGEGAIQNVRSSVENFKSKFDSMLNRGAEEEEEEKGIRSEDVLELLDQYRELESREAAIKTAHVMKGYLEYTREIEREMTYKELADEIEEQGLDGQSMETLLDFFRSMHVEEYTGNINWNTGEVIDASEQVVKELS